MKKKNWWQIGCIVLVILLAGKSCKSCTDSRRYEFKTNEYVTQIDSITKANKEMEDSIKILNIENQSLKDQKGIIEAQNSRLEDNLKNSQSQNQTLINTNHNLSKK